MEINLPDVVAEVTDVHDRYNAAIDAGDVTALNGFFNEAPETLRLGPAENLFGHAEIAGFRSTKWSKAPTRTPVRTIVNTYGRDLAVATLLYTRPNEPGKIGRQMQTWARMPAGWRIVAAHVSVIDDPQKG